jgi:NAD(P)H-hydrate repair Nnr-like enzyme with NAD(P)H-hydrate dehydratase domain
MGDVLTGLIGALAVQGLSLERAGALATWLCGRTADILCDRGDQSHESLVASDVATHLGEAFDSLRRGVM